MTRRIPETAVPVVVDRNFPIEAFAERVKAIDSSGVLDRLQMSVPGGRR